MKFNRYKILVPCVPLPYEGTAVASNLKSAIDKVKYQAKRMNLNVCRGNKNIKHEIIETNVFKVSY